MMLWNVYTWLYKGHINLSYEDHALTKTRWTSKKMNVIGEKFKDEKKWSNHWKKFTFVICYWKLCMFSKFWSSQQHEWRECDWETIENIKGKGSIEEWAQMKARGGGKIVEKNKNKRGDEKSKMWRCVEYLAIGYKVIIAFIIIFGICKNEGV
jgi:hypothetical protein